MTCIKLNVCLEDAVLIRQSSLLCWLQVPRCMPPQNGYCVTNTMQSQLQCGHLGFYCTTCYWEMFLLRRMLKL